LGFKRFGTTFNREADPGLVHVIGFQASRSGGDFFVNLGVYVREVDAFLHDWWGRSGKSGVPGLDAAVREEVCWLRTRLGQAESIASDAERAFTTALNRMALVDWWLSRRSGSALWAIDGPAPLGFALLFKEMGRSEDARRIVEESCRQAAGKPFFDVVSVWAEDLGFKCP
jgi:hypothetical protein